MFTASGGAAGLDMTVAFLRSVIGERRAVRAADLSEHIWRRQPDDDPFATLYRLVP